MKLAIFWDHIRQAARQQDMPLPEMLRRVRALGYSLVELDLADLQADPSIAEQLRAADMGV